MVSDSLRQNGGGTPERNPFGPGDEDETVYSPMPFTPGRTPAGWTETRTRERGCDQWPHPENPGLIADSDGYYDWAGRRLFLPDGSPDPGVSGAYRYQTRPDLCDPNAPDSEPVSPRYEPMWLRHKPGDTWMIGGKPYDPDDPGPYGNPLWRPDRRTGRHRRGERPDPIAPWEWREGDPEPPDFARTRIRWDAHGDWTPDRIEASGRPEDGAGTVPERVAYAPAPGWLSGSCPDPGSYDARQGDRPGHGPRRDTDWKFIHRYSTDSDQAELDRGRKERDTDRDDENPGSGRSSGSGEARRAWAEREPSGPQEAPAERQRAADPRPAPRRPRHRDEREPDQGRHYRSGRPGPDARSEPAPDSKGWNATAAPAAEEPYRLPGLRERAWSEFLADSQAFYEEHLEPPEPDFRDRLAWLLRCLVWIFALGVTPMPRLRAESTGRRLSPAPQATQPKVPRQTRTLPEANRTAALPGAAAAMFRAGAARGRLAARASQAGPPDSPLPRLHFDLNAGYTATAA
ncbi:hypothetical protein AB0B28_02415 [Glycomyces sp. NPDC046736]|uniref:hypothetical protein n=1 Tax=Glycomyces sp. NPDC046736 TaxID=3155615 RepID=UPI0033C88EB6